MDQIIIITAAFTLVYSALTLLEFLIGFKAIKNLSAETAVPAEQLPFVSIIFSALNEEADIEAAVLSLLALDYPHFEVIAINDRSNDNTAYILNAMQMKYARLQVHHIADLPDGWLGKNHALFYGARFAKGEWLLFTDADVQMAPQTLSKAMSYSIKRKLDHLTIFEHHIRNTFWLKILLLANYVTYTISFKPWRIRFNWSKRSLGHGAFNLVNKTVYEKCGTHQAIAFECLDDLKLGYLIKKNGYRQDTVDGRDFVQREWYTSLPAMIEGWKKNTFAYFNYQLTLLVPNTFFALLFFVWPVVALFVCSGFAWWLNAANVLLMLMISSYVCKQFRMAVGYSFFYPAAIFILLYSIWNSVFTIYYQNGVVWRGTHYPLEKLRAGKIR